MLAKYAMAYFVPGVALAALTDEAARKLTRRPALWLAVLIAAGSIIFHILPYGQALAGERFSLATVGLISVTRLILFRRLRYRLDNALFLHPVMVAIWTWIFLRSTWLTGIRRTLLWRGRTYDARQTRFGADRR